MSKKWQKKIKKIKNLSKKRLILKHNFEIGHFWDFLVIYPRDFGAKKMKKKYQKSQKLVKKGANFKAQFWN